MLKIQLFMVYLYLLIINSLQKHLLVPGLGDALTQTAKYSLCQLKP